MHTLSRLRCVSLFLIVVLVTLLGEVGCSDKTTDTSPISEEEPADNQVLITHHKIYFTGSDFHYPVEQYAYGDSIYIWVAEKHHRPPLSPVWLYSYGHTDIEVFLMDDDRGPLHPILEDYVVAIAVLPDTMTGYGPYHFDGTLTVHAGGDSITAYYFSLTHGQLITAGARIGGF